jgi:hypothetical protein
LIALPNLWFYQSKELFIINEYLEKVIGIKDRFDSYKQRNTMVNKYAWAIPCDEAIEELVKLSPLVEIGAGTGYWAKLVKEAGGTIICYDIKPPELVWHDVNQCGTEAAERKLDTLFLCWPPYDDTMAHDCLKLYKGNKLVYIGEGYGGCTGCNLFHELLNNEWILVKRIYLPQWNGIHDSMYIYERKASAQ